MEKKRNILIVEDSDTSRKLLAIVLNQAGYSCLQARSSTEAIEVLNRSTHLCLILTDANMPESCGIEFAHYVRQHPKYASIPIVFITAGLYLAMVPKLQNIKINGVILKPYTPETIYKMLDRTLGKKPVIECPDNNLCPCEVCTWSRLQIDHQQRLGS